MCSPRIGMLALLIFQPTVSTFLHIAYLLKRARYIGQEVERYKMKKILQLADASVMMNNFSSLLIIIFTLHLFNGGIISLDKPALFLLSTGIVMLHLVKMLINLIQNQKTVDPLQIFPVASILTVKIFSMVILLSYKTDNSIMVWCLACFLFLLVLTVNLRLEQKYQTGQNEEKKTFLKAAHSMIFPLAPELEDKKHL